MFVKSTICLAVVACLCQQVASQWSDSTTTTQGSTISTGSTTTGSTTTGLSSSVNGSSAGNTSAEMYANQAPITQFFGQVLRGQVMGLRKCKKPKDCGLGLRCDLLLNLCVPFNTPLLQDIEKPCSNDSECSGMHACQGGLCRFCGPKSCRSNLDCCAGSFAQPGQPGTFYECLNTEETDKLAIAKQLGRVPANFQPMPKAQGGKSLDDAYEVESDELIQLGLSAQAAESPFHGKRCWARCNVDNDCYHSKTPADIKQAVGCCNNVCTRRASCSAIPANVVQQYQQLQQQRLQQNQVWNQQLQQQALSGQMHQHQQHQQQQQQQQAQQSQWGAGGHHFQQMQPVALVQVAPAKPVPANWQEAQMPQPSWQQNAQQQG